MASLERVFTVEAVKPTHRLSLLTALAFLLVAPLPLQLHLGHPERSFEMFLTPRLTSAMAMFGFDSLWYLMVVLLLEIRLDYRRDIVLLARGSTGLRYAVYKALTLGPDNISAGALKVDDRVGWFITLIGIPSAFLLHGYVGFIFGSVKANPWFVIDFSLARDAGPDPAHLRGRRVLQDARLHGGHLRHAPERGDRRAALLQELPVVRRRGAVAGGAARAVRRLHAGGGAQARCRG